MRRLVNCLENRLLIRECGSPLSVSMLFGSSEGCSRQPGLTSSSNSASGTRNALSLSTELASS